MDRAQFHVVPSGDRWRVESNGATLTTHPSQKLAIDAARDQARAAEPSQILVHGPDGGVEQESIFGHPVSDR